MNFAIMRVAKLKCAASIKGAVGHNARTRKTTNADPLAAKKNVVIMNIGPDPYAAVMDKIKASGAKYRSNSVLAQEVFLSASHRPRQ